MVGTGIMLTDLHKSSSLNNNNGSSSTHNCGNSNCSSNCNANANNNSSICNNSSNKHFNGHDKRCVDNSPRYTDEEYLGMVKSYNERRGFGFVASDRTASLFGRDIYIAKSEARVATEEDTGLLLSSLAPPTRGEDGRMLAKTLLEEDLVRFRVRYSKDGMPQAYGIRRMRKFTGVVEFPPDATAIDSLAVVRSEEIESQIGSRHIHVRRDRCGQLRLAPGDVVSFGLDKVGLEGPPGHLFMPILLPRSDSNSDQVLACFHLELPRTPLEEKGCLPNLSLDCHALVDRVILTDLPRDCDEQELLSFFQKCGASCVIIAASPTGRRFGSVAFTDSKEISKLIGRNTHTLGDDKDTRLVQLTPPRKVPRPYNTHLLPGLPSPILEAGEEAGSLVIRWSPIVLAVGYIAELRVAGTNAGWSTVETPTGHFGQNCSSCRVVNLPRNLSFEARIIYLAACGCASDPSDPSAWCSVSSVGSVPATATPPLSLLPSATVAPSVIPVAATTSPTNSPTMAATAAVSTTTSGTMVNSSWTRSVVPPPAAPAPVAAPVMAPASCWPPMPVWMSTPGFDDTASYPAFFANVQDYWGQCDASLNLPWGSEGYYPSDMCSSPICLDLGQHYNLTTSTLSNTINNLNNLNSSNNSISNSIPPPPSFAPGGVALEAVPGLNLPGVVQQQPSSEQPQQAEPERQHEQKVDDMKTGPAARGQSSKSALPNLLSGAKVQSTSHAQEVKSATAPEEAGNERATEEDEECIILD